MSSINLQLLQRPPLRGGSNSTIVSITSEGEITPYVPKSTTDEYIKAIAHHSQQSSAETLYPGEIYDTLRRFLEQKSVPSTANPTSSDFAWLINPTQSAHQVSPDKHSCSEVNKYREQSEGFIDPALCIEALRKNIETSRPQVLFLRGHPSSDWLSSIGAFCHVDPELFRWFLRYRTGPGSDYHFDAAPSVMSNIYRFKFYTIGTKHYRSRSSQAEVDVLRRKAASEMHRYHTELRQPWTLKPGESIVRNFHVLDERHCVIEQEIVVSIFEIGKTWMAIACTDAGFDLTQGPRGPWSQDGVEPFPITLLPIVQYRPRCALKSRGFNEGTIRSKKGKNIQSLAIFPEGYGRGLDWSLAKIDRYHVLSDFFRLAAFSQKQLLNILREKIITETSLVSLMKENPTLVNLLHFREILQDLLSSILYMLQLTKDQAQALQGGRRSTAPLSTNQRSAADQDVAEVHSLLQDLYSQAQSLQEKCTEGMIVISNNSMLAESQRAIQQAKSVTKLTLLAFLYLPFTFTAGFFGMNFKELGNGTISLWIFFAASVPLLMITVAFFVLDIQTVKRIWRDNVADRNHTRAL